MYANLDQYEQAIADYTEAICLDPQLAVAHYNRGMGHQQLANSDDAARDLQRAAGLGFTLRDGPFTSGLERYAIDSVYLFNTLSIGSIIVAVVALLRILSNCVN